MSWWSNLSDVQRSLTAAAGLFAAGVAVMSALLGLQVKSNRDGIQALLDTNKTYEHRAIQYRATMLGRMELVEEAVILHICDHRMGNGRPYASIAACRAEVERELERRARAGGTE